MRPLRTALLLGAAGTLSAAVWSRRIPSACPYNQRFWVLAPHPFITRSRLLEALCAATGRADLSYATPPRRLTGGYWAEMFVIRLTGASPVAVGSR